MRPVRLFISCQAIKLHDWTASVQDSYSKIFSMKFLLSVRTPNKFKWQVDIKNYWRQMELNQRPLGQELTMRTTRPSLFVVATMARSFSVKKADLTSE